MVDWLNAHGIIDWLGTHGICVLVIIIIAVALYFLLRHFVPPLVKRTVTQRMKGQLEEEIKERANTLSSVFVSTGIVVIAIIAIFTIFPEFGVNIATMLAGLGNCRHCHRLWCPELNQRCD